MSSSPKKEHEGGVPLTEAPDSSRSSSSSSSVEGGARLDAADYSPPVGSFRVSPATRALDAARGGQDAAPSNSSSQNVTDDVFDSSSTEKVEATPVSGQGNRGKRVIEEDSDSSDEDDVFSPAKTPVGRPVSAFAQRLSDSVKCKGRLRPSRSVTFKDQDEMISPVMSPIRSPAPSPTISVAATLSERRLARRAVATGSPSQGGGVAPLVLHSKSSDIGRHQVGDMDAQVIYPPTACVFVANLPEPRDDQALEAAVTREFSKYGTVFVKIRRDKDNMPFAFCQFTKNEDALSAMERGKGTDILGRPCRTEMVKANRLFLIWKRSGIDFPVDEARQVMEPYGELSKCEPLHEQARAEMELPFTVLIEFAKFDSSRDIGAAARLNPSFRIDAFDPKKRGSAGRAAGDEQFLKSYDVDRRSIYVKNFPDDIDEDEIVKYFSRVGEVLDVQLKYTNSTEHRPFAFVEFSRADTPDAAIASLNQSDMRGFRLYIERKVTKSSKSPKRTKAMYSLKSAPSFERPGATIPRSAGSYTPAELEGKAFSNAPEGQHTVTAQHVPTASPVTPNRTHHARAPMVPGFSPTHFGHPAAGASAPMHHGMMYPGMSPPVYVPQPMHPHGHAGVYGGSLPNTPSAFPHGMNSQIAHQYPGAICLGPNMAPLVDPITGAIWLVPVTRGGQQSSNLESPMGPNMGHPGSNQ